MCDEKYKFTFDEKAEEYVKVEWNESETTRKEAFAELQEWIKENPELNIKSEEYNLIPFLRSCKFDIQKTKQKMETFYQMKKNIPEWYMNEGRQSKEILNLIRTGIFIPLKETVDGKLVIIFRIANFDYELYNMDHVVKVSTLMLENTYRMYELAHIYGFYILMDLSGTNLSFFKQVSSFKFMKNGLANMKNFFCRPKTVVVFNVANFIQATINLFKSLLPEKLKKRIYVCANDHNVLRDILDVTNLPPEYGGTGESVAEMGEYWYEFLKDKYEWI